MDQGKVLVGGRSYLRIPTNRSPKKEAECDALWEALLISLAEVLEVVKKLLSGKTPGLYEICPEILKVLDIVWLSWLIRCFIVA